MWTYEMNQLQKLYPNLSWDEMDDIRLYWRVFYENPQKYKGTELETMVFNWLKERYKDV
jgi:hypothetical protein